MCRSPCSASLSPLDDADLPSTSSHVLLVVEEPLPADCSESSFGSLSPSLSLHLLANLLKAILSLANKLALSQLLKIVLLL